MELHSECALCPSGRFQNQRAKAGCLDCQPGTVSNPSRTGCAACQPGEFSDSGGNCVPCAQGKFAPIALAGDCITCAAGSQTERSVAALTCSPCEAGKYSTNDAGENAGPDGCRACPAGTASAYGQSSCTQCKAGEFSATNSSTMCLGCQTEFGNGFGSDAGSSACDRCLPSYYYRTDALTCESCTGDHKGFDCTAGGTTTETTPLLPGWWRPGLQYNMPVSCPDAPWCTGGFDNKGCAEGHDPRFPYCSVCKTGYYMSIQSGCLECVGSVSPQSMALGVVFVLLLAFTCFFSLPKNVSELHTLVTKTKKSKRIKATGRMVFVNMSIATRIPASFGIQYPDIFTEWLRWMALPVLEFSFSIGTECIHPGANFYWRLILTTAMPLIMISALGLYLWVAHVRKLKEMVAWAGSGCS